MQREFLAPPPPSKPRESPSLLDAPQPVLAKTVTQIYQENVERKRVCLSVPATLPAFEESDRHNAKEIRYIPPTILLHSDPSVVRTEAETIVWANLIQPLMFSFSRAAAKRLWLVHGEDASGKTALVKSMFKAVEN